MENTTRAFFFPSTCVLWGIFFPRLVKHDDGFSIPGASAARGGNTTRRHYTKLNLFKLSTIFFFMFFFLFFNGGGNREGGKKRVVWVQAAAFWKSSHTKAFFLHLSVLLIAPCSISPREELHYMHNLKQLFFLSCFFLIVLKSAILEVKRHEFDPQTQRQCFFCSLSWFISRSFCYCCHIYSHGPSCRQSIVRGVSCPPVLSTIGPTGSDHIWNPHHLSQLPWVKMRRKEIF